MEEKVLIAGAGPTGLVLALWLTRMGIPVRIVDRNEGPGTTSRATVFHARNLEFYRQIGIDQLAIEGGIKFTAANFWIKGKKAVRLPFTDIGNDLSPYPYVLIFPQDKQEELLIDQLKKAGVEVERNTELLTFENTAGGISARLRRNGKEEDCKALYLAGCDGAHSTVRKGLSADFPGGTYSQTFYVADIVAQGPLTNGEMHGAVDQADFVVVFPMKGTGAIRLVGTIRQTQAGKDLKWDDVSQDVISRLPMKIERINWFSTYRVHHRVASHFREGSVFLLGDAGHIHSPVGGQGMNTGIGDAVNLAWKLAGVIKGASPGSILDTYEAERIPFARQLVNSTDRAFTFITARSWLAARVRLYVVPFLMPLAFRFRLVRRLLYLTMSQTGIKYPGSPLSRGKAGKIKGGDRLPWVAEADNFDVLGSLQWQVHCFGKASADLNDVCTKKGLQLHVFSWSAAARHAGYQRNAAYVVRPDCYVGLAEPAGNAKKVAAYLNSVMVH